MSLWLGILKDAGAFMTRDQIHGTVEMTSFHYSQHLRSNLNFELVILLITVILSYGYAEAINPPKGFAWGMTKEQVKDRVQTLTGLDLFSDYGKLDHYVGRYVDLHQLH